MSSLQNHRKGGIVSLTAPSLPRPPSCCLLKSRVSGCSQFISISHFQSFTHSLRVTFFMDPFPVSFLAIHPPQHHLLSQTLAPVSLLSASLLYFPSSQLPHPLSLTAPHLWSSAKLCPTSCSAECSAGLQLPTSADNSCHSFTSKLPTSISLTPYNIYLLLTVLRLQHCSGS